jgi:glyoxylase-like metal-dependent hydrolase (beta-lactamase superfamily II)
MTESTVTVHRLPLSLSHAYLVVGDEPVLVDTGSPGELNRLSSTLGKHEVAIDDLSLVVLTHGHADHAGSAARLSAEYGIPIAAHPRDSPLLRAGEATYLPQNVEARLIRRFLPKRFDPVAFDIDLYDGYDLSQHGIAGAVTETPGHTAGSISVLLEDGQAIVGDLLMGGYFGGKVWPTHARRHYFGDDPEALAASQQRVRAAEANTLHVGHGGPVSVSALPL